MMKRILVADDTVDIATSIKEMLAPYFIVDVAVSGRQVLKKFAEQEYFGLIIDVDFKHGINGLEIASELRNDYANVKILIFSATSHSSLVRQEAGNINAEFREKPLILEDVLKIFS